MDIVDMLRKANFDITSAFQLKDRRVFNVVSTEWIGVAEFLKNNSDYPFQLLYCLTCVDLKTKLEMHYFFRCLNDQTEIQIKIPLLYDDPAIHTVSYLWQTAEILEREVSDLFGVFFLNHPNLNKLFLPELFQGFPLRKNFEDPINMIKL
ncbi:MAG: NADH-quinone oxidoreductase subunit C [Sediminibacterium sp.]|nr:NADH-quinone oxidoreductase subunit C [Sediminibacterium sp.]